MSMGGSSPKRGTRRPSGTRKQGRFLVVDPGQPGVIALPSGECCELLGGFHTLALAEALAAAERREGRQVLVIDSQVLKSMHSGGSRVTARSPKVLFAKVKSGRLVIEQPTDLPDGTTVELMVVDDDAQEVTETVRAPAPGPKPRRRRG